MGGVHTKDLILDREAGQLDDILCKVASGLSTPVCDRKRPGFVGKGRGRRWAIGFETIAAFGALGIDEPEVC